jgi:hypothetical protein
MLAAGELQSRRNASNAFWPFPPGDYRNLEIGSGIFHRRTIYQAIEISITAQYANWD